jgi:hypothetical protein
VVLTSYDLRGSLPVNTTAEFTSIPKTVLYSKVNKELVDLAEKVAQLDNDALLFCDFVENSNPDTLLESYENLLKERSLEIKKDVESISQKDPLFVEHDEICKKLTTQYKQDMKDYQLKSNEIMKIKSEVDCIISTIKTAVTQPIGEEFKTSLLSLLQEKFKDLKESSKLKELYKELNTITQKLNLFVSFLPKTCECSICRDKEVNRVIVPCGHTFCDTCVPKRDLNEKCFTCKSIIQNTHKIHLS